MSLWHKIFLLALATAILFSGAFGRAEFIHERVKRITVFPLKVDHEYSKEAEDAWWNLREHLTETKRFLVASRNFMMAKDVFQARGELKPADAIILGRILDANALVTIFLVDRKLSMRVYESVNGLLLWSGDIELHQAVPISKQILELTTKLLNDFISSFPYQGAVIVDNMIGRASYSQGEKLLFKADVGIGTQVTVGDTVQLIRVIPDNLKPVFQDGLSMEVFAEGVVVNVDRQIITVQVTRRQADTEIKADDMVRIPDELRRLKEMYGLYDSNEKNIGVELYKTDDGELTQKQKETKPLVTSLSWIGNLICVMLLAF